MNIPEHLILRTHHVRLEPLNFTHENGLRQAVCDGELWRLVFTSAPEPQQVTDYIQTALDTRFPFAVIDERSEQVIGTSSFYAINPEIKRLEIGYTWYAQSHQRTHVNTACKYLLLTYAFETLQCNCVGWRTDILNTRSQAAIERLGAHKDGVLRSFERRKDDSLRDTVMYSMLASEWTEAKIRLQQRLNQHTFQAA
ncbi:GNAT family N-acetyltransferase [Wielerella bovis]|uniref:GNAT family N-acetyltransferase n=1 Tax=Wielerella bovis TaxID=2917790 RepID=UPI002018628B|nr:GNAT family protein [Wielerella bovis]MCG7656604.1 GNAT family N-acetyltransferase [Wielerella bovis]MCG7658829.1 GNAT family N-acetyltransferase [Wielerella bovis]